MGRTNNVNGASERSNYNVKEVKVPVLEYVEHGLKRSGSSQSRIRRAQRIANELTRKFGPRSKSSYRYFCKLAYNLPESTIWNCYEDSMRPKVANSLAYFLAITKAQPEMA